MTEKFQEISFLSTRSALAVLKQYTLVLQSVKVVCTLATDTVP